MFNHDLYELYLQFLLSIEFNQLTVIKEKKGIIRIKT